MKKVMTSGMISVVLASALSAAPAETPSGLTVVDGNTAPSLTSGAQSVVLNKNSDYQISNNNAYWSYAGQQTNPVSKWELTANNATAAGNASKITMLNADAVLIINGALKVQGATMNVDMSKGGRLIVNGAENGKGWWDGTAYGSHFGISNFTLDNGAILEIKKDLRAIGGGTNNITLNNNSMLVVTGVLRSDGNGNNKTNLTATNSTVQLGGITSNGKWAGGSSANATIVMTGGSLTITGDVSHNFDWNGTTDDLGDHKNSITLDGTKTSIGGTVVTDGAYGGQNIITVKNGGTLSIGGNVTANLNYNIISGANVNQLVTDGSRGKLKGMNKITMEGDNSALSIGGDLLAVGGDVVFIKNHIKFTGTGTINVTGDVVVRPKDGATNRKTTWEGDNLNIIDAPNADLIVGKSLHVAENVYGVVKTLNTGNRVNIKNLTIGGSLMVHSGDQSNQVRINGGRLDITSEIIARSKVLNGATGAANYVELTEGSVMTLGRRMLAENIADSGAFATNRIKANGSTINIGGNVESIKGGYNEFLLTNSSLNLNGAENNISKMSMDANSVVTYKGNLTIGTAESTGGTFIADGTDINSNMLTINNSTNPTTYTLQVLSNVRNGDVVAKTKGTEFETTESDDGLLTTKLILKKMNAGDGYTMWVADNVTPILSKTAYDPNKEIVTSTNTLYLANMNSLNKRMGELRNIPNQHGAWGRVFGGSQTNDFANATTNFVSVQAGYDYSFYVGKDKNNYVGAAFSYGFGSSDFKGSHVGTSASGIGYNLTNSSLSQHLIEVAFYNSYVENEGWYNDTILKLGGLLSKMDSNTIGLDNSSFVFTLSDEFGYRFKLGEKKNWFIDPQAEVTVGYVQGGEFTRFNSVSNLAIDYNGSTVLRERFGLSAGYNAINNEKLNLDLYVGLFGEFDQYVGGEMNTKSSFATAKSAVATGMKTDMRGVVNYGVNVKMNKGLGVYVDMEHSFGGKLSTTYKVNGGVRYSFGDTKLEMIKVDELKKADDKAPVKLKEEEKKGSETKSEKKEEVKETKKSDSKKVDAKKETKETKSKKADSKKK